MVLVPFVQMVALAGCVVKLGTAFTVILIDAEVAEQVTGSPAIVEVVTRLYHVLAVSAPG